MGWKWVRVSLGDRWVTVVLHFSIIRLMGTGRGWKYANKCMDVCDSRKGAIKQTAGAGPAEGV